MTALPRCERHEDYHRNACDGCRDALKEAFIEHSSRLDAIRLKCVQEIENDNRGNGFLEGRMDFADVIWRMIVQGSAVERPETEIEEGIRKAGEATKRIVEEEFFKKQSE